MGNYYNYPGNIHVHSTHSDGSSDIPQIADAAAAAGLSYVMIADHENLAGLPEENIYNGVIVLVGSEINRLHSHYLAFGIRQEIEPDEENPQKVIDRVRAEGGIGFIAHPFEKGSPFIEKGKAYPWKRWPVFNFDGLEIWNYTSHWRGRATSFVKTLYWFFINRKAALDQPSPEALKLWDCYNKAGYHITGIGSSDAHAAPYRLGPFPVTIFTYKYIFKTITTYVVLKEELSSDFLKAKKQILLALKEGRCYMSFNSLGSAGNFYYYAENQVEKVLMGEEIIFEKGIILKAVAPRANSLIRLIRNGCLVEKHRGGEMVYKPEKPGLYRVEVYQLTILGCFRPWIYSNPIYVK